MLSRRTAEAVIGRVDGLPADPSARTGGTRTRRRDDRRRQLVGIGLRLLTTTPIHEMSLDQVAAEAGISRSLLFHYFPTKRDFYAAVVGAACRRILRAVDEARDADPRPVHGVVNGLLSFIERRREPYVAFVRGAAGGDAWVLEVYEDMRTELVDRTLAALAARGGPAGERPCRGRRPAAAHGGPRLARAGRGDEPRSGRSTGGSSGSSSWSCWSRRWTASSGWCRRCRRSTEGFQ